MNIASAEPSTEIRENIRLPEDYYLIQANERDRGFSAPLFAPEIMANYVLLVHQL